MSVRTGLQRWSLRARGWRATAKERRFGERRTRTGRHDPAQDRSYAATPGHRAVRHDSMHLWVATVAALHRSLSVLSLRPRPAVGSDELPPPEPKPDVVHDGHRPRPRASYSHSNHLLPWCRGSDPRHRGHPCAPARRAKGCSRKERRRPPLTIMPVRFRQRKLSRCCWVCSIRVARTSPTSLFSDHADTRAICCGTPQATLGVGGCATLGRGSATPRSSS